jgi:hypothetical protein
MKFNCPNNLLQPIVATRSKTVAVRGVAAAAKDDQTDPVRPTRPDSHLFHPGK